MGGDLMSNFSETVFFKTATAPRPGWNLDTIFGTVLFTRFINFCGLLLTLDISNRNTEEANSKKMSPPNGGRHPVIQKTMSGFRPPLKNSARLGCLTGSSFAAFLRFDIKNPPNFPHATEACFMVLDVLTLLGLSELIVSETFLFLWRRH